MKTLVCIDPGKTGAIAVRDPDGRVYVDDMPDTIKDIWDHFDAITMPPLGTRNDIHAILEDVGYHVHGNNATASCTFARHVGHVESVLTGLSIPWESVRPVKWQKALGTMPADKAERKRKIKDIAQRRFPNIKVTLQNADALGMMIYAMIKESN